jgi:prepilin-type N-terminal cleavage/methylation domain-containing protein
MQRNRHKKGFTLMELVLVLTVIAICAAIAAPNLRGFAKGRMLPNTATALVSAARWCRVQALSEGVEYRLNFDTNNGKWWATKADDTGTNFVNVDDDYGREFTVPEGIAIESVAFPSESQASNQGVFIAFRAGGKTDPATITLASESNNVKVTCESPLGSFHIVKVVAQ